MDKKTSQGAERQNQRRETTPPKGGWGGGGGLNGGKASCGLRKNREGSKGEKEYYLLFRERFTIGVLKDNWHNRHKLKSALQKEKRREGSSSKESVPFPVSKQSAVRERQERLC